MQETLPRPWIDPFAVAKSIALDNLFHPSFLTDNSVVKYDSELMSFFIKLFEDGGMIHNVTIADIKELWRDLSTGRSQSFMDTLLQMSSMFFIGGFYQRSDLMEFIDRLMLGMVFIEDGDQDKVLLDNTYYDTTVFTEMPEQDFKRVLVCNPWYVFLLTLQSIWDDVYLEVVDNNKNLSTSPKPLGLGKPPIKK